MRTRGRKHIPPPFSKVNKCIGDDKKAAACQSTNCIKKIKYGEKRFSIWRMEFLHPAMWNVAVESLQWIYQVAAPCNVTRSSGSLNSPGGSTLQCGRWFWDDVYHGIRPNVRHIGILHLVSILTISPQSTCHSAPVCEILSKSDHPQQKKMTSCRFSRWRISAILDFMGPIMGSL